MDHVPCLQAWQESLGGINYPLCSDFWPHGVVAEKFGVFRDDGTSERAIFIVDEQGIIRYIDIHDIDDQPDNEILFDELKKLRPDLAAKLPESKELPKGDVIMYCTPWCADCKKTRQWLDDHDIEVVEINIEEYPQAKQIVRGYTGGDLITPTLNIRGEIIIDYDLTALEKVFKIK